MERHTDIQTNEAGVQGGKKSNPARRKTRRTPRNISLRKHKSDGPILACGKGASLPANKEAL